MFAVFADGTVAASGIDDISSCGRMRSAAQLLLDYNSISGATETSLGAFLLATRDGGDVTRYFRDHTQFEADHRESVVERNWNARPLDRRVIDIPGSTPQAVLDRHVPATVVLKVPETWRFTNVSVCTRVTEAWGPECAVLAGANPLGSVSIHAALPKDGSGVEFSSWTQCRSPKQIPRRSSPILANGPGPSTWSEKAMYSCLRRRTRNYALPAKPL